MKENVSRLLDNKKKTIVSVLMGMIFIVIIITFYSTFSLETQYQIQSDIYVIEDGMILNVSPNTSVEVFLQYFDLDNCTMQVVDDSNHEIVNGYVTNGSKVVLYDSNGDIIGNYVNVIMGDSTLDGVVDENDLRLLGEFLVHPWDIIEYQKKSMDIDGDGSIRINDVVLLDSVLSSGYESVTFEKDYFVLQSGEGKRVLANIKPSYGLNQNLVWSSSDENVATVDESGKVTGHLEGEAVIRGTTQDGCLFDEVTVKVDNTIQLSSYEGIGYVNGNAILVDIKLIDYKDVSCSSSNESMASCLIQDKRLILTALGNGSSVITVTSPDYGSATYQFTTYTTYLNVMPKYLCKTPGNTELITVSGFHTGELSFEIGDNDIVKDAYMMEYSGKNMLRIDFGTKEGRTTLTVKESNGNASNVITIDNTKISIPEIGRYVNVGEEVITEIVGDNLGDLICSSSDEEKATCRIEGNQLIVTPILVGDVTITVNNIFNYNNYDYDCGESIFLVVIR